MLTRILCRAPLLSLPQVLQSQIPGTREVPDLPVCTSDGEYHDLTLEEHNFRADAILDFGTWRTEEITAPLNFAGQEMGLQSECSDFAFVNRILIRGRANIHGRNANTAMLSLGGALPEGVASKHLKEAC